MIFWLTWPVDWLAQLLTSDRAKRIEKEIEERLGHAGYLTMKEWSDLHGIPEDKAEQQLEAAVRAGVLEKMHLYRGPLDFVVPKNRLETKVSPEELGVIGDDAEPIFVSKFRTEPVYVARVDVKPSIPIRDAA